MRDPRRVPDPGPLDVTGGWDTDGDDRPDTVVTDDGVDLLIATDLDGDGLADQELRIGPDGTVRRTGPEPPDPAAAPDDPRPCAQGDLRPPWYLGLA